MLDSLAKLSIPKNPTKNSLKYEYGFVIIQCKVLDKRSFHMDIKYTDKKGEKKKINFHGGTPYSYTKNNITEYKDNIKVPVGKIVEKLWVNLQFDLKSFALNCEEPSELLHIDSISVSGFLIIRKMILCNS